MLAEFLAKYKSALSLAFTVLFCLSSLIWQSNILVRTASQAVEVLDLFTAMMHSLGQGLGRFFDSYRSYAELQRERDLLREELKEAKNLQVSYLQLLEENQRLRQLLQLSAPAQLAVEQAEVISQDPDNWFRTIIINKGKEHGIEPYMPVVAYQVHPATDTEKEKLNFGVVGKVIQVNRFSARILPISDSYSRLGVMLKKTGHWALLVGRSPGEENPVLEYLSLGVFLRAGDELITSGGDGIFPRGLPVGVVGNRIERLGSYQRAEVIPIVDLKRLDFVFILRKKPEIDLLKFPPLTPENVQEPPLADEQASSSESHVKIVDEKLRATEAKEFP
ncbi:MAG: rod shape-determining protein MreC [Leptospiraceae bacterium]|nr:rod shape-determining protein MreC [Leptospiraceae bacterium]MDW8306813.1 rod shape-determining protein MreC [Leptospiraceae bacterium]